MRTPSNTARRDAFLRMKEEKYSTKYMELFLIGNRLGKNTSRRIVYSMCTENDEGKYKKYGSIVRT